MATAHSSGHGHDGDDRELMAPHEVARIFRVSPATITRWARVGLLASTRTPGGHRRFERASVMAHLERLVREGDADRTRSAAGDA
ncbi:MerR family DNA-binding transcriptional regulator [Terrabacter sp. Ter38]|uniref:MerR family DNA-binding transcriptional regulator n=1 Tax=Terrabacter sp. Ter38 TaxID=2926030 RepID=UPI0021197315|nr:helix-turn-helix domain-containing protein [Terrabacter sp. Ter38]